MPYVYGTHSLPTRPFFSAIPFSLYAFAALHVPTFYSVTINSASPLFGALFAALWLGEKLTPRKCVGLLLGAFGVALAAKAGAATQGAYFGWAIGACLIASACYGLTGVYIKRKVIGAKSKSIAGASQLLAGLLLSPSLFFLPYADVSLTMTAYLLILGLLCSGVAYLLYYRLMADVGPTKALTVTFLIPVFGILWGAIFLGEIPTPAMGVGTLFVILGTLLVLFSKS